MSAVAMDKRRTMQAPDVGEQRQLRDQTPGLETAVVQFVRSDSDPLSHGSNISTIYLLIVP